MVKISDKAFATIPYLPEGEVDKDNIYALRIDNGKIFFIGWMENAENYAIQMSNSVADSELDKNKLLDGASMYDCITSNPGYNDMYYAWEKENGKFINPADAACNNEYERFLTLIDSATGEKNHKIFCIIPSEIKYIIDSLRDGNYVFINYPNIA